MKKKLIAGALSLILLISAFSGVLSASAASDYPEIATYINGEYVELAKSARLISGYTYVPLRALAAKLGATKVEWKDDTAVVYAPGLFLTAASGKPYIYANGRFLYTPEGIKNIGGSIMVPVRAFCKAFDAEVEWNGEEKSINIITGSGHLESSDTFYDEDELYWLSRIINGEARGESLEGMIAVGNVVMNRVRSTIYPDNVYDVVFDFNNGIQFSPAADGSIYLYPSDKSMLAAKLVLDGADIAGDCLFFAAIRDCWAAYARPYVMTIGGHDFYL